MKGRADTLPAGQATLSIGGYTRHSIVIYVYKQYF
jgi:hypothetical protein